MSIFLVIVLLLILIFIPIPIKIKILSNNKNLSIYFFKYLIFSLESKKFKKYKKKGDLNYSKKKNTKFKLNIPILISTLYFNKFKPKLKFKLSLDYSLTDAAYTALLYGYSNLLIALISGVLNLIFEVKNLNSNIYTSFKNDNIFSLNINCIIYLNFAKIIYILILYFYKLKFMGGKKNG